MKNKYCKSCNTSFLSRSLYCIKCRKNNQKNYLILHKSTFEGYVINGLLSGRKGREHLTLEIIKLLYNKQNGLCALTTVPLTFIRGKGQIMTNMTIDRIDSSKGYELDNIQLVCYAANTMKNTLTDKQLVWWCEQIIKTKGRTNVS